MPRPWEHIHRLHFLHAVTFTGQDGRIAGGGGGVAADIDQAAGRHADHSVQGRLVAAFAGRVHDDDIGGQALGGQPGGCLAGVGTEKAAFAGDLSAHPGRVGAGAFNGLGNDLHPHQLPAAAGHRQSDGAHAAVKVQQQVVGAQVCIGGSHGIQLFCAGRVHLIKGEGAQPDRHPAEGVLDRAGAKENVVFRAQDHIGVLPIDIDQDGGDVGKLAAQLLHPLAGMGRLGRVQTSRP